MDAATAQPIIDEVDNAIAQAESEAASASGDAGAYARQTTAWLRKSFQDWSTRQLAQTQANTRTDDNWTKYGGTQDETDANSDSLLAQAKRFIRDNGSVYVQWYAAIQTAGNAAQAVASFVQSNLADWRTALNGYEASYQGFLKQEADAEALAQALAPVQAQLPPESQDLLYGAAAHTASAKLTLLRTALDAAEATLGALEKGAAAVFDTGDVRLATDAGGAAPSPSDALYTPEITPEDTSAEGLVSIGMTPLLVGTVAVAGLVGTLALCGTLCALLVGYYRHLSEIHKSDETLKLLDIIKDPAASAAAKAAAKKALDALDTEKPFDPFGDLSHLFAEGVSALKAVVATGVLVGGGWLVWSNWAAIKAFWQRLIARRATNPRRRRRNARRPRRRQA